MLASALGADQHYIMNADAHSFHFRRDRREACHIPTAVEFNDHHDDQKVQQGKEASFSCIVDQLAGSKRRSS